MPLATAKATYDWERGIAFYLPGVGNALGASSQPSLSSRVFSGPDRSIARRTSRAAR